MKPILFSVVICTMNRPFDIEKCLESISLQFYPPYEVIVVDASNNKDSTKIVSRYRSISKFSISYIRTKPGLTKQRNIGIQNCKGDIVAFFDDDVILDRFYFEQMALCFNSFPEVAGATGYIYNNPTKKQFVAWFKRFFLLSGSGKKGIMLRSGFAAFIDPKYISNHKTTQILSGCNMLYRRDILKIYQFDEVFEGYSQMEDVEFSHRVSKNNLLMYVKKAKLIHNRSDSGRLNLEKLFEMSAFNHFYIFVKNVKTTPIDWFFFVWSDIGLALRFLLLAVKTHNIYSLKGFFRAHLRMFSIR